LNSTLRRLAIFLGVLGLLYLFLVSIGMIGAGFKLFGKGLAQQVFEFASNPICGLFIGILATSLVQSSSTTTSIVVGLVAGGMPVPTAIPIIMGANIGTSVTNTLVSLGHIARPSEFKRAFAASTVHDFFNLLSVLILFPLQYFTNFLGRLAGGLATFLTGGMDVTFDSPIKAIVKPTVKLAMHWLGLPVDSQVFQATLALLVASVLLFISLKYMTRLLRGVVMQKAGGFFERTLFSSAYLAFTVGVALTVAVQSSSITTSLVVPLAGAGILSLQRIYPYTLGANVGTTVTAIIASLAAPENFLAAATVALSHLLFNVCGICAIVPLRPIRLVPLRLAEALAALAVTRRWMPIPYIVVIFFLFPVVLIYFTR
jgi:sodium-dependent phosphate cotransporter